MKQIRIALVAVGGLKYNIDYKFLLNWKSTIFKIVTISNIELLPNSDGYDWMYTDNHLTRILTKESDTDLTVGIINHPLENNYYARRLAGKVVMLSLYEMADIVKSHNFSVEMFIIRNLYEFSVFFRANENIPLGDEKSWAHDDIRGCLFDMNANKPDIIYSMNKPSLCYQCETKARTGQIDREFISTLNSELKRITKPLYFNMVDYIENHPLYSILLTALLAFILNVMSNLIYDSIKSIFLKH